MSELVFVKADSPAALAEKERVPFVEAGKGGGKMIRHRTGQVAGPIGGEALRHALARGAVVIAEVPPQITLGKSVPEQQLDASRQEVAQQHHDKDSSLFNPAEGASGCKTPRGSGSFFTPRT